MALYRAVECALWLPKRERGAESVCLVVCLFVCLFIFGLVWFWFSQRKIFDTKRRLFFRSSKRVPPSPSLILLFSLLPPKIKIKKKVDKAGVEGFSFSYSFFPLCKYSLISTLGSLIYTTCPFSSFPAISLSLSLSLPLSPPPYLDAKQHRTGTFQ